MEILKLGSIVTDQVTGLKGMLTCLAIDMGSNIHYAFQPAGLNPETKEPLNNFWITEPRAKGAKKEAVELPIDVLGTEVEDKATGFKGTAVSLYYYLNGCVHFDVKPKGVIKKSGESIKTMEFDLRRLKGKAIKELTPKELAESKKKSPSPEARPSLDLKQ